MDPPPITPEVVTCSQTDTSVDSIAPAELSPVLPAPLDCAVETTCHSDTVSGIVSVLSSGLSPAPDTIIGALRVTDDPAIIVAETDQNAKPSDATADLRIGDATSLPGLSHDNVPAVGPGASVEKHHMPKKMFNDCHDSLLFPVIAAGESPTREIPAEKRSELSDTMDAILFEPPGGEQQSEEAAVVSIPERAVAVQSKAAQPVEVPSAAPTPSSSRHMVDITAHRVTNRETVTCVFHDNDTVKTVHDYCSSVWDERYRVQRNGADCSDDLLSNRLDPATHHQSALCIIPIQPIRILLNIPLVEQCGASEVVVRIFNLLASQLRRITTQRTALVEELVRIVGL